MCVRRFWCLRGAWTGRLIGSPAESDRVCDENPEQSRKRRVTWLAPLYSRLNCTNYTSTSTTWTIPWISFRHWLLKMRSLPTGSKSLHVMFFPSKGTHLLCQMIIGSINLERFNQVLKFFGQP